MLTDEQVVSETIAVGPLPFCCVDYSCADIETCNDSDSDFQGAKNSMDSKRD